jgi:hypothetical protein
MWRGKQLGRTVYSDGDVMKKYSILLLMMLIAGCSAFQKGTMNYPDQIGTFQKSAIQASEKILQITEKSVDEGYGVLLQNVKVSLQSFNPSQGQHVDIFFALERETTSTIAIFDSDNDLIVYLLEKKKLAAGAHRIIWNGCDSENKIVPDEAYYFTVTVTDKTGKQEIYDPTVFSGGETHDITEADIDPINQTINYIMPEAGRVMIRMGIQNGPMLNQLVDWQPRAKGSITEYWDGRDADKLMNIYTLPNFKMIITYFSFPQNTIIAFGNKETTFLEYKEIKNGNWVQKEERNRFVENQSHHYRQKRTLDFSPALKIEFSNARGKDEKGLHLLYDKALVKVDIAEKDQNVFRDQQFEICFFLDHEFYSEDETGYTPFNWVWDLENVKEGEHVLTVNISSFSDQVAVISSKVKVVK